MIVNDPEVNAEKYGIGLVELKSSLDHETRRGCKNEVDKAEYRLVDS